MIVAPQLLQVRSIGGWVLQLHIKSFPVDNGIYLERPLLITLKIAILLISGHLYAPHEADLSKVVSYFIAVE